MDKAVEEAFQGFIAARSGALMRTAYLLVGDRHRAEDLLQTALVKTFVKWSSIRDLGAVEGYVRRTMMTTATSWWRGRPYRERLVDQLPDRAGDDGGPHAGTDMTDPLAERLVATLDRRAGTVGDGPRFAAADVVRAGHRAIRRRRIAAGAAAMAVVGGILAGAMIARPPAPPPTTPATTPSPTPSASAVVAPGVDLVSGNTIYRTDGSRVTLALPEGQTAWDVLRAASGWVVGTDKVEAWFVPDRGSPRSLGSSLGGLAVSPDGRVVAVANADEQVQAYELPSLREIGRHAFHEGLGPIMLGVAGDVVLLTGGTGGGTGDSTSTRAAVWNLRTGSFQLTSQGTSAWSMSDDGHVVRGVDDCVDVVTVTDHLPLGHTGWCSKGGSPQIRSGDISLDGTWVALGVKADDDADLRKVLIRTADLRAGRWRPVPTGGPSDAVSLTWLTGDTFVLGTSEGGFLRCRPAGRCVSVAVPPGVADPQLVRPRTLEL